MLLSRTGISGRRNCRSQVFESKIIWTAPIRGSVVEDETKEVMEKEKT